MRMVDRIHHDTPDIRASTQPSIPACFPDIDILVIRIPNLPDGCHAGRKNSPHFTGAESYLNIFTITPHDLGRATRTTNQLSAFSRFQLYIVNGGSQGHAGER
jgi:hypothetical protein